MMKKEFPLKSIMWTFFSETLFRSQITALQTPTDITIDRFVSFYSVTTNAKSFLALACLSRFVWWKSRISIRVLYRSAYALFVFVRLHAVILSRRWDFWGLNFLDSPRVTVVETTLSEIWWNLKRYWKCPRQFAYLIKAFKYFEAY